MTQTQTYEFSKLDTIDLKVACWLNCKCPDELYNFLHFVADKGYQRKGIDLNVNKAYDELIQNEKTLNIT